MKPFEDKVIYSPGTLNMAQKPNIKINIIITGETQEKVFILGGG